MIGVLLAEQRQISYRPRTITTATSAKIATFRERCLPPSLLIHSFFRSIPRSHIYNLELTRHVNKKFLKKPSQQ